MARKPTHKLIVTNKMNTERTAKIGVAWQNDRGHLSIILSPGTVLDWRMCDTHWVGIFPMNSQKNCDESPPPDDDSKPNDIPF